MYFISKLREKIRVPPHLFAMEKNEAIKSVLNEFYAKKISRENGFIVEVLDAEAKSNGIVIAGDPHVYYDVEYEALSFKVDVNEIFLGKVMDIMEFGAFVNIGPFEGLLHVSQISKDKFVFNKKAKTLKSSKDDKEIKKGDLVLVKVSTVSMKSSVADVKISLTMRADGLGKLEWLTEKKKELKKDKEKK